MIPPGEPLLKYQTNDTGSKTSVQTSCKHDITTNMTTPKSIFIITNYNPGR